MRAPPTLIAFFILLPALAGCGKSEPTVAHNDHDHVKDTAAPATFKEGHGLQLADETSAALGVKTAEVAERAIAPEFEVTATVFDAGPPARASSLVLVEVADALEKLTTADVKVLEVRRDFSSALSQVEMVLALPGSPAVGTTINLTLRGAARDAAAVPHAAVLRSATGTFVYVVNGAHLLRTPVKTGANDSAFIEITDGLYAGDVVVTAAVDQLWLTELRLTKGGGHSH